VWHVWGRAEVYTGFWWGNLRERNNLQDPGVDGRIILRCIFRNWDVGYGMDRAGSENVQVAGTFQCEPVSFSRRTVLHGVGKYICLRIHTQIYYI